MSASIVMASDLRTLTLTSGRVEIQDGATLGTLYPIIVQSNEVTKSVEDVKSFNFHVTHQIGLVC
jgi:hypothetical protein